MTLILVRESDCSVERFHNPVFRHFFCGVEELSSWIAEIVGFAETDLESVIGTMLRLTYTPHRHWHVCEACVCIHQDTQEIRLADRVYRSNRVYCSNTR